MAMTAARKAAWVLAVWAVAAAAGLGAASARAPLVGSKPQREFDYFALSLQWPGTICASTSHCCASNGCCRSEPLQTFTIHGLWPDYDDGTWPSCCRRTQFDMDKILPLKETLDKYWPSLYCSSSSTPLAARDSSGLTGCSIIVRIQNCLPFVPLNPENMPQLNHCARFLCMLSDGIVCSIRLLLMFSGRSLERVLPLWFRMNCNISPLPLTSTSK